MDNERFSLDTLIEPVSWEEIEWKIQALKKGGGSMTVVPYITSRCVQERFDRQFGWENWDTEIREVSDGILCKLTVTLPDGRQVSKMDGASRSDIEPLKGGISDALKRVAVQFGMGRDLYDFPRVMVQNTPDGTKYLPKWLLAELKGITDSIAGGDRPASDVIFIPWRGEGQSTGAPAAGTPAAGTPAAQNQKSATAAPGTPAASTPAAANPGGASEKQLGLIRKLWDEVKDQIEGDTKYETVKRMKALGKTPSSKDASAFIDLLQNFKKQLAA